jgi:hypothetical protein
MIVSLLGFDEASKKMGGSEKEERVLKQTQSCGQDKKGFMQR